LTTKGTFHIIPDAVLVWNDVLVKEARTFHDVPQDKLLITGAPVFDFWFEMQPTLDYPSFCNKVGISADQPYVLYLCSSKYISGDETSFVRTFAKALGSSGDTQKIKVLVRPHPLNSEIWDGVEDESIAVWPRSASWVDTPQAKLDYYHSIYHSRAVIGVNTSAIIEAAILDRPCVTIVDEEYKFKQNGQGHFGHLINAGFMEITHSFAESAAVISAILTGEDSKKKQRRRFVSNFIRPHGLDRSASEIMASAIEAAALRKNLQQLSDK
jgi:CDP-glycerol glycerophosphotransferase (TagB/SpsB family)